MDLKIYGLDRTHGCDSTNNKLTKFRDFRQKDICDFHLWTVDNHLTASKTSEEHMDHIRQFSTVLQDNGLTISPAKCSFASSSLKFFGNMVSESKLVPLPRHVSAVQSPNFSTFKEPRSRFQGINSASLCIAWRAGTITLFLFGS